MNSKVICLFVSPETKYIGEAHRQFSIKSIADFIASNDNKISDLYMTLVHETNFESVHKALCEAEFDEDKVKYGDMPEFEIENMINVPLKMLMSPLQLASSVEYYAQREDPYAMMMEPVMKPMDVVDEASALGWVEKDYSSNI